MTLINITKLNQIIHIINDGGVAIIPTETVYGIVCKANNDVAIDLIYKIKERTSQQPLQVLISDPDDIFRYLDDNTLSSKLIHYWPGSLTAVVSAKKVSSNEISSKLIYEGGIGLRCPDDALARKIIKETGVLAATSANKSKEPTSHNPFEINQIFEDNLMILNDGERDNLSGSTVISYTTDPPSIIRKGILSNSAIQDLMEL